MVNYAAPLYQYPPEVWDKATCRKHANHTASDGLGTKYPFKGYIGSSCYGTVRYNGGTVIADEWWQGVHRPLPVVHEDFEITTVPTWGYRIIQRS